MKNLINNPNEIITKKFYAFVNLRNNLTRHDLKKRMLFVHPLFYK